MSVTQIELREGARELTLLEHVDYTDCFLVTDATSGHSAEEWARAMIEGAPAALRQSLRRGWFLLGLKHGAADDPDRILGWELRRRRPDHVLLGADSRIGMPGELLFKVEPDGLLFATFIEQRNPLAKAVWASIAASHRRIVSEMLGRAAERLEGRVAPVPVAA